MKDDEAIPLLEPLKKLRRLNLFYPNATGEDFTYRFAAYLSDPASAYFCDEDVVSPEAFLITYCEAMLDIAQGTNSYSGRAVPEELRSHAEKIQMYATLDVEGIAHTIFPHAFAVAVAEMMTHSRTTG